MNQKRILLINHYAGSRAHGMEFRPLYLAREWQKMGWETTVVAASFSHLRRYQPDAVDDRVEETVDGIRYVWLKTPQYSGNGLKRVFNILAFVRQLYRFESFLAEKEEPAVVLSSSTYPLGNLPAHRIARRAGARFVLEIRDLWPMTPMELGGISKWHPYILLMQWAENYSYRNADWVTCTLPNAADHMVRHGLAPGKFVYIPNGISTKEWEDSSNTLPAEHLKRIVDLKERGGFLLGYAGSHGVTNALSFFVDAAALIRDKPVAFIFIGQGPEKGRLERLASSMKLKNVLFLPAVAKQSMPAFYRLMDGCFIGWRKKSVYRFGVSPNKLLDYMMAEKPVVHAIDSETDLVTSVGCGFCVPPEEPKAIANAVQKLMAMTQNERLAMGRRGREHVEQHHDFRVLACKYVSTFQKTKAAWIPKHELV